MLLDNLDSDLQQELDGACRGQLSAFGVLSFRDVLNRCEDAYQGSRYPFEPHSDPSKYPLGLLMACSHFLQQFVAKLQTKDKIRC
jgi:hypothetical protein